MHLQPCLHIHPPSCLGCPSHFTLIKAALNHPVPPPRKASLKALPYGAPNKALSAGGQKCEPRKPPEGLPLLFPGQGRRPCAARRPPRFHPSPSPTRRRPRPSTSPLPPAGGASPAARGRPSPPRAERKIPKDSTLFKKTNKSKFNPTYPRFPGERGRVLILPSYVLK